LQQATRKVFDDVFNGDGLTSRVNPPRANHDGQAFHQMAQHLEWSAAGQKNFGYRLAHVFLSNLTLIIGRCMNRSGIGVAKQNLVA
jgi:hypothetical protein